MYLNLLDLTKIQSEFSLAALSTFTVRCGSFIETEARYCHLRVPSPAEVSSVTGTHHGLSMPGSPQNISKNDSALQKLVFAAACAFNNQSNDAFLFKPADIIRAQKQIVKGVRFLVDFKISRTVCQKRDHGSNLSTCDFQPAGRLQLVSLKVHASLTLIMRVCAQESEPIQCMCCRHWSVTWKSGQLPGSTGTRLRSFSADNGIHRSVFFQI
uniref:Cystatin domain-containing protein n=1 Tax=Oryzias sinensis TaxID=183150 RepID=A0A8C7YHF0_9TELE